MKKNNLDGDSADSSLSNSRILLILFTILLFITSHRLLHAGEIQQAGFQQKTGRDLDVIKNQGKLRIIVPANIAGQRYLPRKGSPVIYQQQVAEAFAQNEGLSTELVIVEKFSGMIPALVAGKGDIIAANMTINKSRRKMIDFTLPLTHVREQVIVSADNKDIIKRKDLSGKSVMVDPAASFWKTIQHLQKKYSGIELLKRPAGISDEDELDLVANGQIDAVVRDSNIADMYLGYRDDIKVVFNLGGVQDIAWGVRKNSPGLKSALDHFLHAENLSDQGESAYIDDFPEIKKRKVLRVLLRNNASSYFLHKGELIGFEYEMAKAFAKAHKLRLHVVVADTYQQLLEWLVAGKADMAVGFLEPQDTWEMLGIVPSQPYHFSRRHVIVHKDSKISTIQDLYGKTVNLRVSSPHWRALSELSVAHGNRIQLSAVDEEIETETLIQQVANREIEITVADSHLLDIEMASGLAVKSAFILGDERPNSVAVRQSNPKLKQALDAFIKKNYKGLVYNVLYKKYFKNKRSINRIAKERRKKLKDGKISPYDQITRRYAEEYGFDWRLITAQMYQESRFKPEAKSFTGAKGLLQVMPRTAKSMGFKNLEKPETGIHAGVKYLDWVRNRFEETLPFSVRTWFTLASYNAGYGHVLDARRLAKKKGWDPDKWFGNVERAMLLLSQKKYSKKAKHGFVRGQEPVAYVNNIRERFNAYVDLTKAQLAGL